MNPATSFAPLLLVFAISSSAVADVVPNKRIDSQQFLSDVRAAHELREKRRITEEQFVEMANDKNTIILDARSANRFQQLHVSGAKNLPFTDFTEESLREMIPSKDTRVLIYCNNNVANSPVAFANKAPPASLNLSTYPSLYSYGYKNVFELGPEVDPKSSKIRFEGTLAEER